MFLLHMRQAMCVLPVRCRRCNAVFDLWYDLQELEHEQDYQGGSEQSLCWRCREVAQEESHGVYEEADADVNEEADEDVNEEVGYTVVLQYE